MNEMSEEVVITATQVPTESRMDFLPNQFGRYYLLGEALVYGWLRQLSEDYTGGFWNFYTLSNGGFYIAPDADQRFRVVVPTNWFEGELSADAAGIVATIFALGQLASEVGGTDADAICDAYHALCAFAGDHKEGGLIFRAID